MGVICLLTGFNTAYAQKDGRSLVTQSEQQKFRGFMAKLCRLDTHKALSGVAWQVFPGPIRVLLDNQFVFQPFWGALNHSGPDGSSPTYWRDDFD